MKRILKVFLRMLQASTAPKGILKIITIVEVFLKKKKAVDS